MLDEILEGFERDRKKRPSGRRSLLGRISDMISGEGRHRSDYRDDRRYEDDRRRYDDRYARDRDDDRPRYAADRDHDRDDDDYDRRRYDDDRRPYEDDRYRRPEHHKPSKKKRLEDIFDLD